MSRRTEDWDVSTPTLAEVDADERGDSTMSAAAAAVLASLPAEPPF